MSAKKYCITNAQIWNENKVDIKKDVFIVDGIVEKIVETNTQNIPEDYEIVDLQGQVLMPSGVDLQVHLRIPGQEHKETPETCLQAALHGGYGVILNMPNTKPVLDNVGILRTAQARCEKSEKDTGVKVLWSAAVTKGQAGEELVDFQSLADAGVVAFTEDGIGIKKVEHLRAALEFSAQSGLPILEHAENYGHGGALGAGPVQEKLEVPLYKRNAEWEFVKRDLATLEEVPGARYHVLHVSTRESVGLIQEAKAKGLKATAEVSPHHLYFCTDDIKAENTSFKMNPPLQQAEDRQVLQKALAEGVIDYVATDHAPHEKEAKSLDLAHCAYGTTGLESSLRVLLGLYQEGLLSPERLVRVFSTEPARFIGIAGEYGQIAENRPFRAIWVDAEKSASEFTEEDVYSLSKNNVFLGTSLPGRIRGHFNGAGFFRF